MPPRRMSAGPMVARMITLRAYTPADAKAWDELVAHSRNGNLLHQRGYMDYHADRFVDASVMVERNSEVVAVLPANIQGDTVTSHAGLSYAGLIMGRALRAESTLGVFEQLASHYRALGAQRMIYKAVPQVFHVYPAGEDLYALHRLGARLQRRDLSSVISLRDEFSFTPERRRVVDKARKAGLRSQKSTDLDGFHTLLTDVLRKHNAVPTHSLSELRVLQSRFPQHITLYETRTDDGLLAAALVYDFGRAVHTQYLAASDEGRRRNALTVLLADLIENTYATRQHFSLGVSTEQQGQVLNSGLVAQKEYFGARAVVHDFYEWLL
jgi:hypothetical protein